MMVRRRAGFALASPLIGAIEPQAFVAPAAMAHGLELRPIAASAGQADLWPARQAVVVRHVGRSGLPMSVTVPLKWYRGVAVDIVLDEATGVEGVRVVLAHQDPALEVQLFHAADDCDVVAEWRGWARDLNLPLLLRTEDGDVPAEKRLGPLVVGATLARRAPRTLMARRPKALRRRKAGTGGEHAIHRGEREIIAYE